MIYGRYVYFEAFDVEFMKTLQVPIEEQYKATTYAITSPEFMDTLNKCQTKTRKLVSTDKTELENLAKCYVDIINAPQPDTRNRVKCILDEFYNLFYKQA